MQNKQTQWAAAYTFILHFYTFSFLHICPFLRIDMFIFLHVLLCIFAHCAHINFFLLICAYSYLLASVITTMIIGQVVLYICMYVCIYIILCCIFLKIGSSVACMLFICFKLAYQHHHHDQARTPRHVREHGGLKVFNNIESMKRQRPSRFIIWSHPCSY